MAAVSRLRRFFIGASLHSRVLLVIALTLGALAVPTWLALRHMADNLVADFGVRIAERQVQYDRYRGLETLKSEIALAATMVRSPNIIAWMRDDADADISARGIAEMEHYRNAFSDQSVFIAADASGRYYFNDAQNSYGSQPYRYTLRANNPRDGWYYATKARREGCFANVDHDDVLRVTKVWINCIITDGGDILGVAGTGLDFSGFIREVVDIAEPGVTSIFVDQAGAVQAHRDASLVDFHSLTKTNEDQTTIFSLLSQETDHIRIRSLMSAAAATPDTVQTAFVTIDSHRTLVGVGYLEGIGWYNVTLLDLDAVIDRSMFVPIGVLLAAMLTIAAFVLAWIFRAMVLDRLVRLEKGLAVIRSGEGGSVEPDKGDDEIGRLSRALFDVAPTLGAVPAGSEVGVGASSAPATDNLTGLLSRGGFKDAFLGAQDHGISNGLLVVDVDRFSAISEQFGTEAGKAVIADIAHRLKAVLRRTDICARWSDDAFMILIRQCDMTGLAKVTDALLEMMRRVPVVTPGGERISVTVSIGAVLVQPDDLPIAATDLAEAARYMARDQGGDRAVIFSDEAEHAAFAADSDANEAPHARLANG